MAAAVQHALASEVGKRMNASSTKSFSMCTAETGDRTNSRREHPKDQRAYPKAATRFRSMSCDSLRTAERLSRESDALKCARPQDLTRARKDLSSGLCPRDRISESRMRLSAFAPEADHRLALFRASRRRTHRAVGVRRHRGRRTGASFACEDDEGADASHDSRAGVRRRPRLVF